MEKMIKILFLIFLINLQTIDSRRSRPKLNIGDDCKIPNQKNTRGICVKRQDCAEYEELFNVDDLGVERLSFLLHLNCGFDTESWKSLVCCPKPGNTYKKPDLDVDLESAVVRESETTETTTTTEKNENEESNVNLDNRFGEETGSVSKRKCGVQAFDDRIVGGELCEIDEFPWAALLLYESKTSNMTINACGGALIHSKYVLTAGHCVKGETIEKAVNLKYARMGEYDLTTDKDCIQYEDEETLDCAPPPVDYEISEIIPHPSYDPKNPSKHHDLALLRLKEKVRYNDFTLPICLPTKEYSKGLVPGYVQTVCGWGKTDYFRAKYGSKLVQSPIKLKVSLPYVDKVNCTKKYADGGIKLSPSQICAGGQKAKDSCSGDSGSPLMFFDNKKLQWILTGIVSFGQKRCGTEGYPAVYVNVTNYLPWIEHTISARGDDEEDTLSFT